MSQQNEPMVRVRRLVEIEYAAPVSSYPGMTLDEIRAYEKGDVDLEGQVLEYGRETEVWVAIDGEGPA